MLSTLGVSAFQCVSRTSASIDKHCRDADAEEALGDVLSEISNTSSAPPLPPPEAPSRKRKAAASRMEVLPANHLPVLFGNSTLQGGPAEFLSPRERILALRDSKKAKRSAASAPAARAVVASTEEDDGVSTSSGEWPLTAVTESLVVDLLSPTWFVRHGAALGIIEIMTAAGPSAGCRDGLDAAQQRAANTDFLGGVAACLLVMLALDRYADFDSQVRFLQVKLCVGTPRRLTLHYQTDAAPVRGAAANALSVVVSLLPEAVVSVVIGHVGVLLQQDMWEVRLSGMLAVKGILRVCRANLPIIMAVVDLVAGRLHDDDDDVRAVITDAFSIALATVAKERAELLPQACVFAWQALRDDFESQSENFQGAFTEPVLKLLAALYTTQQSLAWAEGQPVPIAHFELLSKFARDPRKLCRREAARSIAALCNAYAKEADRVPLEWKMRALAVPARFVYEALLLEVEIDPVLGLHNALGLAWRELLLLCGDHAVAAVLAAHVPAFLSMSCTPLGMVSSIVSRLHSNRSAFVTLCMQPFESRHMISLRASSAPTPLDDQGVVSSMRFAAAHALSQVTLAPISPTHQACVLLVHMCCLVLKGCRLLTYWFAAA